MALGTFVPGASVVRAQEPSARGVVVVALPGATDATWPVAKGLYGRHGLLPGSLADADARVLAGEPPPEPPATQTPDDAAARSTARLRLLARLRDEAAQEPTRKAALTALARETQARGAVLVGSAAGITVTRTFAVETGLLGDALTVPSEHLDVDKIAADARTRIAPKPAPTQLPGFLKSPWTWIAVGAAALAGTAVYLSTRGEDASPNVPLRLRTDR